MGLRTLTSPKFHIHSESSHPRRNRNCAAFAIGSVPGCPKFQAKLGSLKKQKLHIYYIYKPCLLEIKVSPHFLQESLTFCSNRLANFNLNIETAIIMLYI